MRDHSPLRYVTVDVNLCNFCHKLDVFSVNFILRMGSRRFVVVEVISKHNRFIAAELRSHITLKFRHASTAYLKKKIYKCMYKSYIKHLYRIE